MAMGEGWAVAAALMAMTAASPAAAQMVTAKDPKSIVAALEAQGWPAKLVTSDKEDPTIETNRDGIKSIILLLNCNDAHKDCRSLQFYMGFNDAKDTTLEKLNEWNKTKRFGRAYRDSEGDPVMEMDVDTDHNGVERALFNEYLLTWAELVQKFRAHLFD